MTKLTFACLLLPLSTNSLSVTPHKLVDEVTMVTHTMFGGTVSKHFMPNRIVKRAVADDKGEAKQAPWQRFKVAGENGFFLLDDKVVIITPHSFS
jgi:hypothetical protein